MTAGLPQSEAGDHSGPLDETLASLGAGAGADSELPFDRGDLIGRYVVLEEVGQGAMGVVVAAYDPELDRKVALKLMHVGPRAARGASARLLREAQAMARLSHPNVITVHDVGTAGDDVFIAMEFVEGGSLREWLAAHTGSWQDLVRVFIQAGQGLAAAHREGIVHRDFKPDNVLVREDGRVCVGDFGLARRDESAPGSAALDDLRSTLRSQSGARASVAAVGGLTLTGATMGTPAYMAPEQHLRRTADHRADQFAFCVALWEALVGERPFAGTTLGAIAFSVTSGQREPFPRDSPVPARVRAALERGLSSLPDDRFADMDSLLDELRAALRRSRGRSRGSLVALSLAGLGVVGMIVASFVYVRGASEPSSEAAPALCSRAEEQLTGVWDPAVRDAAERAFAASERPFAGRSFERVAAQLDQARADWIDSHTQACEATRVYGEQSEELLDRRMSCLAQRRSELAAVGAALVAAEPETVSKVDDLLGASAPISSCNDLALLEGGVAAPPPEQREQVEALRARAAELEVLRRSADGGDMLELAARLVADAEALGYDPVLAEALYLHSALLEATGPNEALPVARRAATVAAGSGHRAELARALSMIAWLEGTGRANFELGLWLLDQAEAELVALGEPTMQVLQVKSDRASILTTQGDYEAGLAHFERALAFAERELGPEHMRAADLRFNIAATQHYLGRHEQAEQGFRASVEVYTKLVGPDHPEVAQCHNNLAAALVARGKAEESERHARRAIEIWEANGADAYLNGAYGNLGDAALVREDYEGALALYETAYAMKLEVFGPDHPITIGGLGAVARTELRLGRLDDAQAHFEQGLARLTESVGDAHSAVFEIRLSLAELAHLRGHDAEALAGLVELEQEAGETGRDGLHYVLAALVMRAAIEGGRGRSSAALEALDRAEALFEAGVDETLHASANELRAELEVAAGGGGEH
ncbi:Serine/threonine-protein kinase PK-1 [Enhygromyxa salina]|uniref:Serine/threonine-protein kinase PK-1 n=1 Tax=Enhygromyxa salina TaxID=215803 RepID=A0A2S9XJ36_9BACT|nr:serine/threonine-protein kinase [Enhygromyxa salina]PRP92847.1 Serine/threonine-protein kinase PK-1 [Enhygromyxa salina]